MKLLHEYQNGDFIWVYPEPEFTLDELKQHKQDFENHPRPNQKVLLVDNYYHVVARKAVVLHDKHGKSQIRYANGIVLTRDDIRAIEIYRIKIHGAQRRRA